MLAVVTQPTTMWSLLQAVVFPLIGVAGAAGVFFSFAFNYRKQRQSDIMDAVTTWQATAEARQQEINNYKVVVQRKDREIYNLRRRNNFLWKTLLKQKIQVPDSDLDLLAGDTGYDDSDDSMSTTGSDSA